MAGVVRADLYGTGGSNLFSIDETTGAASLIGPFGEAGVGGLNFLDGLASIETVVAVPEPTAFTLFLLGLAALGFARRRWAA